MEACVAVPADVAHELALGGEQLVAWVRTEAAG